MAKRSTILAVIGIGAALLAAYLIYPAFVSPETRVRWVIEGMADAFNRQRAGSTVAGLADDFAEEETGAAKQDIQGYLFVFFRNERDDVTKEFLYRVELDDLRIEIPPGKDRGQVQLVARFLRRDGEGYRSAWETAIDAAVVKGKDGWKIASARHRNLQGKRPF